MPTYASTTLATLVDGNPYCTNRALTSQELDLGTPISVVYNSSIIAVVTFNLSGNTSSYVVMQTSVDGGTTWVDMAWCVTTSSGILIFVLSGGMDGANAFQNTRAAGTAPLSAGSNQIPLGGLIRFVGKGTGTSSSSSSSAGSLPPLGVSISYKTVGLR
jgi:hypothetical protein